MPDCELSIEFDQPSRIYKAGETVTGRVIVKADEDVNCNGLTVTCGWETHGKGDADKGPKMSEEVFSGSWQRGLTQAYPFSFELPPGPITYHGELVNVDWYIHARADVPWAFDPKCEEDFLVELASQPDGLGGAPDYNPGQSQKRPNAGPFTTLVIGLIFLGIAGGCGYWWYTSDTCFALFFGFFAGLFGLIATLGGINGLILKRHVGDIVIAIEPVWTMPGKKTNCLVTLRPNKPTTLNAVHATLRGEERATYSRGTDRVTAHHKLYEEKLTLSEDIELRAGQLFELQGEIPIPADATYSFSGGNNAICWVVEVDIDIKGLPDFSETHEVTVTY